MDMIAKKIRERAQKWLDREREKMTPRAPGEDAQPKKKFGGSKPKYQRPKPPPDVFADADVCRLLGVNRKALMRARKGREKGTSWDCVEHHAGMTAAWILSVNPKAEIERIAQWAIQPGDGIVSVEVVQHTQDSQKLVCRRMSDGETVVVRVRDASRFMDGEQFDAAETGGKYIWSEELNRI